MGLRRDFFSLCWILTLLAGPALAGDWPGWRGPGRDGRIAELPVPAVWPPHLAQRWRVRVGSGDSSPVSAGGRVFQHSRQEDDEVVRALDLDSGAELWRQAYPVPYRPPGMGSGRHAKGPSSTPTVAGGRLFTLGISGILSAWDAESGKLLWRLKSADLFPAPTPRFGASSSPLVTDDLLVAHLGGKGEGALLGLDPASGEERWRHPNGGPAYGSPIQVELGGVRQIVAQSRDAYFAVAAESGKLLWQISFPAAYSTHNAVTPVVYGEGLLILSGNKRGTWAVRPRPDGEAWRVETVWRNDEISMYMSSPVVAGDRFFGLSHPRKGQLFAAEAATGKVLWSTVGRTGDNAALLSAPGVVLMLTTGGELVVLDAAADRMSRLASYRVADRETWAHPAVAGKGILIKDADALTLWTWWGEDDR